MKTIAHEQYPEYRFDQNKGYGTQQHLESLAKYGPCELHRHTFLRKFFERQLTLFINE
jgi:ribonuclease HII